MSYNVYNDKDGNFVLAVKVHGQSINEWNFGLNEEVAQSKTMTVIQSYTRGLEFVQSQVRGIFEEVEDSMESDQHTVA